MTPEQLLRPRYKVIAAYPHIQLDQHGVGDIISPYGMGFVYPDKVKEMYDSYPHLFKKLEWWEERSPEDLPEYIKSRDGKYVKKVIALFTDGFRIKEEKSKKGYRTCDNYHWLPATEEEYTTYLKPTDNE